MLNPIYYYRIGGITVQVEADFPIQPETFHSKFTGFAVDGPGETNVLLRHHLSNQPDNRHSIGKCIYSKSPWEIYKNETGFIYLMVSESREDIYIAAYFNPTYTSCDIYHSSMDSFTPGGMVSLSGLPTDQIILGQVLADHQACYLHSAGVILDGKGYLFVGHSGAGKSTMLKQIRHRAQILCDDRNIVRRRPDGFHLYGTWSHGEIAEVSAGDAPLKAIFFLKKAQANRAIHIEKSIEVIRKLPLFVIKPLVSANWWQKTFTLIEQIAQEIPCYQLEFDRSGKVLDVIESI